MKKVLFLLLVLAALLIGACSENDDPTDVNIYGYKLHQFIDKSTVNALVQDDAPDSLDYRDLFMYEIVGSDDWSPRQSVNAGYDLDWNTFKDGYLVPSDEGKTWFPNATLPSAFKVKNTDRFRLYRKVDVNIGRASYTVELKKLAIEQISNWDGNLEPAIKLADLVPGTAAADTIWLVAHDGYSKPYTQEQFLDGYYLLNSEVTYFPTFNDDMTGAFKKFKRLAEINAPQGTATQADFTYAPNTNKCLEFTVPTDFSSYDKEILTNYTD